MEQATKSPPSWKTYKMVIPAKSKPCPDSKVQGANTGPTWVLSAPDGPHVGPMNLTIRVAAVKATEAIVLTMSSWNIQRSAPERKSMHKIPPICTEIPKSTCTYPLIPKWHPVVLPTPGDYIAFLHALVMRYETGDTQQVVGNNTVFIVLQQW